MADRPPIPADLERSLMIEAGYRCAICKQTDSLNVEHIEEWARVKEHKFENMIVLCANCHGRKVNTSDPRHINRASLKRIKSNLMMLNGRYSDMERRVIEAFRETIEQGQPGIPTVFIPENLFLLVRYLMHDGFVSATRYQSSMTETFPDGTVLQNGNLRLALTPAGRAFIVSLMQAAPR